MEDPAAYLRRLADHHRAVERTSQANLAGEANNVSLREQAHRDNDERVREVLLRKKTQIQGLGVFLADTLFDRDNPPDTDLYRRGSERHGLFDRNKIVGYQPDSYLSSGWSMEEVAAHTTGDTDGFGVDRSTYYPAHGTCLLDDGDIASYEFPRPDVSLVRRLNLQTNDSVIDFEATTEKTPAADALGSWAEETMAFPEGVVVLGNHLSVVRLLVNLEWSLTEFAQNRGIA